jgi:hypothetical protein
VESGQNDKLSDQATDVDVDITEMLTDLIYLRRKILVASKALDSSIITQSITLSGTSQWSDYTNSERITTKGKRRIRCTRHKRAPKSKQRATSARESQTTRSLTAGSPDSAPIPHKTF